MMNQQNEPLELIIKPGMPVVDCEHQVSGRVASVTPSFCILRPDHGTACYYTCPWEHIAIGNIQPAPMTLPQKAGRKDRLNYLATLLGEFEGLRTTIGLTPVLEQAYQEVLRSLRCG